MQLFLDNDIILKLTSANLLQDIEKIFNTNASSIFILPGAKNYISKSKRLKQKYSQETLDRALSIINNYSGIPDEFIDQERLINLSNIEKIDTGEQILFSIVPDTKDFLILTGDKNAIIELNNQSGFEHIKNELIGKIVCLEFIILKLLELYDFYIIAEKIIRSDFCGDIAIKLIFDQSNLTVEKVKDGFNSYYNDLKKQIGILLL